MSYELSVNSANPPREVLIVAKLIEKQYEGKIKLVWCNVWKEVGNVRLTYDKVQLLGSTSNEVNRYFARTIAMDLYGSTNIRERTEVDHWLSFAIGSLASSPLNNDVLSYLDGVLMTSTWLVAKKITLADIHVFSALLSKEFLEKFGEKYCNITRWYKQLLSMPIVTEVLASIKNRICQSNDKQAEKTKEQMEKANNKQVEGRKQEGKYVDLPGAEMGKVVVRFPPEASGYLHIGHAKAALLNQYYAENFQGQLIMRFDDTNPAKENVEFEQAILQDLELLQIKPNRFTHSSDYFDLMLEYCTKLIKEGKAFVDDAPAHIMKEQREQKLMSTNRNNSVEKNLALWYEMQQGTEKGQECCVRAKIDYQSANGCLRDPTIYRCKPEPHPRTGTKYKVYPTYDFACPIVDAVEHVTHTLRTTEYHDRDDQFYWFINALGLERPYIYEYSRLNMTNTVLSKRKLTWFVSEGLVDGWDDPRFPTVRGILRRGMTVEGLKQFILAQGSSRSVVFMEWDKIWAFNKKVIDPIAVRYTALTDKTVPVHIVDAKEEYLTVQNHPKDPNRGTKQVRTSPVVLVEKEDAEQLVEGQNATFINWGNIKIEKIERQNGSVSKVMARLNIDNKDYKNTLKITWLASNLDKTNNISQNLVPCYAVYFDHIINKPILGKDDDFKDFIAKDTRTEVLMLGEEALRCVKKGEIIELQRKGFFRCDIPYAAASPYSSREQFLILFHIPDGRATNISKKPGKVIVASTSPKKISSTTELHDADAINNKIMIQGNKVRDLKATKAEKALVEAEVKVLLGLKAEYKAATGNEWKPDMVLKSPSKNQSNDTGTCKLSENITQQNQKIMQLQKMLNEEMNQLNHMKNEYKNKTGTDWTIDKVQAAIDTTSTDAGKLSEKIKDQGDKVRQLKSVKADKSNIEGEVKILLKLKADYKSLTGQEWTPTNAKVSSVNTIKTNDIVPHPDKLSKEIQAQGDKVRQLKSSKADKGVIDQEVKHLLMLKADYKTATGQEWKPSNSAITLTVANTNTEKQEDLSGQIQKQGDKVRQLKSSKADKGIIDQEVKLLLKLKADYKTATGQEWKLSTNTPTNTPTKVSSEIEYVNQIAEQIQKQGDNVRELKNSKMDKGIVDEEVKILLSLKNDYKTITGQEWKPSQQSTTNKKKKEATAKNVKSTINELNKKETVKDLDVSKTGTRLGMEVKKEENFFEWYSQIITKSGMIEYYDVSGCYILRPWSFAIWKVIKEYIDKEITKLGVQECYFPIFVTRSVLEKEKAHIADFAPEVAWVTKCGDSDIAEPIAIRPTSETVMYPAYAKWLRSDSELPLKLNQWNNVVRWEFKDPKPFLRTREFLWQEGHTAFASKEEADEEVLIILDMYARVYEDLLAVPVIKGRKTEKEKFAGGDYTTTVEAFISSSGRAIQGATSHHLGQNFSKMFGIQVEGAVEGEEKSFVYQNSWGLTTRTIGVMIMVHGDDKGLVLPPNVASIQAIVVPCGITATTTVEQRQLLSSECNKLMEELSKDSNLRVTADYRSNRTPGWKFNHWELRGVPVRIELGPMDLKQNQVTFVRRDTSQRVTAGRSEVLSALKSLLANIQSSMLNRARENLNQHIKNTSDWKEFCSDLNKKNIILSPFCGEPACEDNIKADSAREDTGEELGTLSMGAKSLCIPFDQPKAPLGDQKCIHPNCQNKSKFYTLFGRSY
ncbi:hypothetical protein KM043_009523 [Ampulex compressa]|nr:hypothetical protein KM043_009523 [Ampulex compressa]